MPTRRRPRMSAGTWCLVCGLLLGACPRNDNATSVLRVLRGLSLGELSLSAQAAPSKEYQVKAVFLFNFAQFVEWPPAAFTGDASPLVIGVLGEDPFGEYLDEVVRAEKVGNRPMRVQRYHRVDEITTCHVLFISRSEESRLVETLASLKGRNILIVGDSDDFIQRAGMIQLATSQGKIRLRINVNAARTANLTISSKLLRSAELVTESK
jgi:YfiR/HmsC-like